MDRNQALGLRPPLAQAHAELHAAVWASGVPVTVLELCRLRMAQLLRCEPAMAERTQVAVVAGLTESRIGRLAQWPSDPEFDRTDRACLEFTELFVIDHHSITDDQASAVRAQLGEAGFVAFTTALSVWENQHRFDNAIAAALPLEV